LKKKRLKLGKSIYACPPEGTLEETIDEEDKLESPNWKEYYKDKKFEISNNLSEMVA